MKTIFDPALQAEIAERISKLDNNSKALWGKMTVYQMVRHCTLWEEMIRSDKNPKRAFVGWLFGKLALKELTKDDSPLKHSTPTSPELKVAQNDGDVMAEGKKWIAFINSYKDYSNPGFIHPFFGKMTRDEIGYMAYKHADHHLRQFNA